jgi:peptide/nickel transport system permease protein
LAQILSIVLGMALGIIAAWKSRTNIDFSALIFSLIAWSLPTFWLGIILLFIGSRQWGLPIGGRITPGLTFANAWEEWKDIGRPLILPTLTYTIVFLGEYMLIMRSTLLDVLSEDYILTAKAKGLSTFQILKDHALRKCALRAGLSRGRDHAQLRRPERDGLQPLCRHALLLEQLPVQSAAL